MDFTHALVLAVCCIENAIHKPVDDDGISKLVFSTAGCWCL
jgi:hypothetical protein